MAPGLPGGLDPISGLPLDAQLWAAERAQATGLEHGVLPTGEVIDLLDHRWMDAQVVFEPWEYADIQRHPGMTTG